MAHVWNVIDGDIYVSKNGNDVTGDGSMAAPYSSLNKGFLSLGEGEKIVIGTGVWREAISTKPTSLTIEGDGTVIFDGLGLSKFTFNHSGNSTLSIRNLKIINYYDTSCFYLPYAVVKNFVEVINCHLEMRALYITYYADARSKVEIKNSLLKNIPSLYINAMKIENCTFENNSSSIAFNCRVCVNNIYKGIDLISDYQAAHVNCAFFNTTVAGTPASEYNIYNILHNPIFLDPKFNNPEIGDYTLKSDSPCLYAGKNNSIIGAFGLGYSYNANSPEFTKQGGAVFSQTSSVDDIVKTQQAINGITRFLFQLAAGHLSGNIESAWIDMQQIRYLLITRLFANIIYNTLGVATSRPDNLESAGEKAVYYDFELKYCNNESEKAAASWKKAIWNKAVTIDNSNRGNADSAFVPSEAKYISARFIKIKLYMTEA